MPKIKLNPIAEELRGSIGDIAFYKRRGRTYAKRKSHPPDPATTNQQPKRQAMTVSIDTWHNLSSTLKKAFSKGAKKDQISGVNDWVRKNINPFENKTGLKGPQHNPDRPQGHPKLPLDVSASEGGAEGEIKISWTDPGSDSEDAVAILVYDATADNYIGENLNAATLSAESYTISGLVKKNNHLIAVMGHHTGTQELEHAKSLTQKAKGVAYTTLSFNGTDDYVQVPWDPSLMPKNFTLTAWVKPFNPSPGRVDIIDHKSSNHKGYGLRLLDTPLYPELFIADGSNWYLVIANSPIDENKWTHIAGVSTGTQLEIYIDGELDNTSPADIDRTYSYNDLTIGRNCYNPERWYEGELDDLRIHPIALTQSQIQDVRDSRESPRGDEKAYWPVNECSGDTLYDRGNNTNHGTIYGPSWNC